MKLTRVLATAIPTLLAASTAHAVRQPSNVSERPLETAQGKARTARAVGYHAPQAAQTAWRSFLDARGSWRAIWDADTAVPTRVYGEGIAAPGSVADGIVAESYARQLLAEQIDLLAPGANAADFTVVVNQVRQGIRQVRFGQNWRGMSVVGATVSFTFAHDRMVAMGSTAAPHVAAKLPTSVIGKSAAQTKAAAWVGGTAQHTGTAMVLPIVNGTSSYHVVLPVLVTDTAASWTVYVDASTGAPVARRQNLLYASGTVKYHVPIRHPLGGFEDAAATQATHTVDGGSATSDTSGVVSWASASTATLVPGLVGPLVRIQNAAGALATANLSISPAGTTVWDESTDKTKDAQLTGFVRINEAKLFVANTLDNALAGLNNQTTVNVNVNEGTCNAYYNPEDRSLNFFPADSQCGNTGELADVMRHEFGHALHHLAFGSDFFDGALSEGISDYIAATMADDSAMGLGFFVGNEFAPLRDIDPAGEERVWPDDVSDVDVHETGLIIAGALWDLRKAAVASLGQAEGVALTDDIFYGIIARADDIPASYTEALVTDDDNGNLADGTPHDCMIAQAFALHGLGDAESLAQLAPPAVDNLTLTLDQLPSGSGDCPSPLLESATATWRLRSNPATGGTVDFTDGGATFTATLPDSAAGEVIQYQVVGTLDNGNTTTFPQNAADQWYEVFVGNVVEIYCTDFETDPAADGWTLGNGFAWGSPQGLGTDPAAAYDGTEVLALALGGDYQPQASYSAVSPEIDVTGYEQVRLQYQRWLGVEDATYDHATISVDGSTLWENLTSDGFTQHVDKEWRFHDVDLTAQAADGTVQVTYGLTSDGGVEFGGWTVDHFCVVGITAASLACGNGDIDGEEECDDGNHTDGDGCSAACLDEGGTGGCCSTSDERGTTGPILLGLGLGAAVLFRRKRRDRASFTR